MNENNILKNTIKKLLNINTNELYTLNRIVGYCPFVLSESLDISKRLKCKINWTIISKSVTSLTKYSIDYSQIEKEVSWQNSKLDSLKISKEVDIFKDYIESIIMDNTYKHFGEIISESKSTYTNTGKYFKDLILNNISLDDFYIKISKFILEELNKEAVSIKTAEPLACCSISNNSSLLIFDIDYYEDALLVGTSIQEAKWYLMQDSSFLYGDIPFSLEDFIRI